MKKNTIICQFFVFCLLYLALLSAMCFGTVNAQTYKPGDLYTFEDGSQGIVFYVNPDNPSRGTVVALHNLDGQYALWTGSMPQGLLEVYAPYSELFFADIQHWESHGKAFTQVLVESGVSPAAAAMDVDAGWYIPDAMQLYQLYASAAFLQNAFDSCGGDIASIWNTTLWSATRISYNSDMVYAMKYPMKLGETNGTTAQYIRPVRDFPDTAGARAFWSGTLSQTDTVVSPDTTTIYNAYVIYRYDTIPMTATVSVYLHKTDTLYDTVYASPHPYTPAVAPSISNVDVSLPGDYEYHDTLQTVHGCDSVITLLLTVSNYVHYTDTLCPLKEDYYFAPFDTVFAVGTVSGTYIHHGTKTVDGEAVDTVAYYDLTVLPDYEVFDTIGWCLYESHEARLYDGNPYVSITVDGSEVSVISDLESLVIEEITDNRDYAIKMYTVNGCDSVVFLHVDARRVVRDTIHYKAFLYQVEDQQVTVSGRTFTGITEAGAYVYRDTLMAENGCDSVVVHVLTVTPCVSDFSVICPSDVYDTLAYGDCVMTIYPERLGTPTVLCDIEWPFSISNDIPEDSLFMQGDNIVTWVATDTVCGNSVTCEQHVFVAFPQCPDAVDYEGNVYHGVRIGCDCWTQRNLESTRYSDGDEIEGRFAYADWRNPDTMANVSVYGRLYSYEAAVRDSADNGHGHIQGICPEGWYLPTPEKYEGLNAYGTAALRSSQLWLVGSGDNSTGFTALPAGLYNGQLNRYEGLLTETYFWSTQGIGDSAIKSLYSIVYYCDTMMEMAAATGHGYSVRCIKEREE